MKCTINNGHLHIHDDCRGESKLMLRQALLISLVIIFSLGRLFYQYELSKPIIPQAVTDSLVVVAKQHYEKSIDRINNDFDNFPMEDYARSIQYFSKIDAQLGRRLHPQVSAWMIDFSDQYRMKWSTGNKEHLPYYFFDQEVIKHHAIITAEQKNGDELSFRELLSKLYSYFWLLGLMIILIRRWPGSVKDYISTSPGDVITTIIALICYPIGVFKYYRFNEMQNMFDTYLDKYKQTIGSRGWRLSLAYVVALIITLASLLKPPMLWAQNKIQPIIITVVHGFPSQMIDIDLFDGDLVDSSLGSAVCMLRRKLMELFAWLRKIFQRLINLQAKLLAPVRQCLWFLVGHPIRSIPEEIYISNPINAPNGSVISLDKFITNSKLKGVNHEKCKTDCFNFINNYLGISPRLCVLNGCQI